MKKFDVFVGTIHSTTIEANSREEAIEKVLEFNDLRIEEED